MGFESQIRSTLLLAVGLAGMFVGMVFSPVVLSLGTIVTVAGLVLDGRGVDWQWSRALRRIVRDPLFWGLVGLYLVMFTSVWRTEDWGYLLERLRIKLPLLVLPVAWAGVAYDRGGGEALAVGARRLLGAFVAVVLLGVLVHYALDYEAINAAIAQGQAVPVPRGNHVRFSLLVAIASVVSLHGAYRYRDGWLVALGTFLFVGLHLLAVRTGLAVVYAGTAALLVWIAVQDRKYKLLLTGMIALVGLPVVAYLTVPTFQKKLQYMRYELLHRDRSVDTAEYSDEGRLTSIRLGLKVWREHPWFGVGYGNLLQEMDRQYARYVPGTSGKRPHNQFVSALAAGGIVGGTLTVACFALIGWGGGRWRYPLHAALWTMLTLSCLVENTLETSVGVSLFTLTFLLFGYPPYRKPG